MSSIATYVFIDLETTGLPSEEDNRTKITELSMVAVKRDHVLETRPGAIPRVQHKLTLCFNPCRLIQPSCTDVTGLSNDLLEHEPVFNMDVFNMINTFLNVLSKPVCLIAQNGHNFDFPILKSRLVKLGASFPDDVMCADCYHAFYDIMEAAKKSCPKDVSTVQLDTKVIDSGITNMVNKVSEACISVETTKNNVTVQTNPENKTEITTLNATVISRDETDLTAMTNTLPMKLQNETTPKQPPRPTISTPRKVDRMKITKARRRFPWSEGSKPTESYKLKDIYERLMNRPPIEAHRAENDCLLALECSVALSEEFVKWIDENHVPFADIKPMTVGVRLGH